MNAIVARRNQLSEQLILTMIIRDEDEAAADRMMQDLIKEYGRAEVARMWGRMLENLQRPDDPELEAAQIYGAYVKTWERFGGEEPLLSPEEYRQLQYERAALLAKPMLEQIALTPEEVERANAIGNQILAEPHLWDDLVPPDPPRRAQAVGASSPPAQRPGRNEPCWCGSGRKYKHCHLQADATA